MNEQIWGIAFSRKAFSPDTSFPATASNLSALRFAGGTCAFFSIRGAHAEIGRSYPTSSSHRDTSQYARSRCQNASMSFRISSGRRTMASILDASKWIVDSAQMPFFALVFPCGVAASMIRACEGTTDTTDARNSETKAVRMNTTPLPRMARRRIASVRSDFCCQYDYIVAKFHGIFRINSPLKIYIFENELSFHSSDFIYLFNKKRGN